MQKTGKFISFEGVDGSGKSTQAKRLSEKLKALGYKVVLTREPGGSPGAEEIRKLLVEGQGDRWSAETEILLFSAARRDHLEQLIWPALESGSWVICDRFADSTRVYQGATRGGLRALVDDVHSTMIGVEADQTFILSLSPKEALSRGLSRATAEDRFESMGLDFQERLAAGYAGIAKASSERCIMIDASGQEDIVEDRIWRAFSARWKFPSV